MTADSRERLAQARTHDWRARASRALGAWHAHTRARARERELEQQLTWHHVQHVQAAAWHVWRRAFEARCPHHKLLRYAYVRRGRATMRRVSGAALRWVLSWLPSEA